MATKAPAKAPARKPSFLQDVLSIMSSNVFVIAISFVSGIILSRQLSAEGRGIHASIMIVPSILVSLVDMGIRQATIYQLGKKEHRDEDVISVTMFFMVFSSVVGVAVCFVAYLWLDNPNFTWLMIGLALLTVPLQLVNAYSKGIVLGKQQVRAFARISWVPSLLRLVGIVVLVWLVGFYVVGALLASLLASAFITAYSVYLITRHAPFKPRFIPVIAKQMVSLGVVYASALFLLGLNYRIDILILERLATLSEVGQYTQGVGVAEMLWQVPTALSVVIFSRGANAKDSKAFSVSVTKLMRVTLVVASLGSVALGLVAVVLVPIIYGSSFVPSVRIIHLLLPGIVAFTVFKVLNMDLAGKGRPAVSMLAAVPGVIINIVLNLLFVPRYGANGAALASTISYTLSTVIFLFVYARVVEMPIGQILRYRRSDFDFVGTLLGRLRRR